MKIFKLASIFLLGLFLSSCGQDNFTANLPAKNIDLDKYLGAWYEIARLPNWFEKDLVGVTATYTLKENGEIEVKNKGYLKTLSGEEKLAIGKAWIPDIKQPGRLKVSFFFLFAADYVVFEIDKDYQYALVGSGKDYLWVLSRTKTISEDLYQELLLKAKSVGYDIDRLEKVKQI